MTDIPTYTAAKAERMIRAKSVTGEYHVEGWLDLRGAKNPDPAQWWTQNGEVTRWRCIAICPKDGYFLVQTDTDRFSAGCRQGLTRKQALAHWNRKDARAQLFTAAINASMLAVETVS